MSGSALELPSSALEDWRYVDCRPLAASPASQATVLPGRPCAADAFPEPSDATHRWALAGERRAVQPDCEQLLLEDRGGCWALLVELAPRQRLRLCVRRHPAAGRSASWLHCRLAAGSCLEIRDEHEQPLGVHLAAWSVELASDATCALGVVQRGGLLQRQRLDAQLLAPGAEARVVRLAALDGARQAHLLARVTHAVGPTRSRQLAKAVLADAARSSFDGLIRVLPGADGSDALQRDHHLLLSPQARADSRPQLDVRADEVQAAHGATIGRLDAEEQLYLRQRGLPVAEAERLLVAAFLAEAEEALP
ncbi:MAG: SufD family Fe-S cluster assembly protein [Planctomycetota bacterium]|nr:SufD family Fe-S cluster assembly protein [Planctomycetota bacterium]